MRQVLTHLDARPATLGTAQLCRRVNIVLRKLHAEPAAGSKQVRHLIEQSAEDVKTILSPIDSVKNPLRGKVTAPKIGEIIFDIPEAHGEVVVTG